MEFLSRLGEIATQNSKGLIIILDELQQLLGPLDARAIIQFREFVWGMRTEHSPCGIILALDSLLEARLARWASDILHRIRENGPALQLTDIYTKEFPAWLWEKFRNNEKKEIAPVPSTVLSDNILISLGQFVERPDLANGPRTVIDVFSRAITHHQRTGQPYDIHNLIEDVHQGRLRYFGEGAVVQSVLTQILSDEWILEDESRKELVTTLAAFPQGCSKEVLHDQISDKTQIERIRSELFAPLLVELSEGLALEPLQQVRRNRTSWEQILSRCWERLPSFDALAAQTPNMILRVLAPKLFPSGTPLKPIWEWLSDESSAVLTGWYILRGTFDDAYPQREVALCITDTVPQLWPKDVDISIALVCDISMDPNAAPSSEVIEKNEGQCILVRLPILKPLVDRVPADLLRYEKYIQPEPFRPVTILAALHDLEAFLGDMIASPNDADNSLLPEEQTEVRKGKAFVETTIDFVMREILTGTVDIGTNTPISLRGPELLRALFTQVCRQHFPNYHTLTTTTRWRDILSTYRKGLNSRLNLAERQGQKEIVMPKADMYKTLFGLTSTAAGDSFIKKLGQLVESKKNSELFSLRLTMHPAENALLDHFKRFRKHQSIPFDTAVEFLRHQGYIESETEEIVKILISRECIARNPDDSIRLISNPEIERNRLLDKIAEVKDNLLHLAIVHDDPPVPDNASIIDLQEYLNQQQRYLETVFKEQVRDLNNGLHSLQDLIGSVRAIALPTEWSTSDLSTHLTGITIKLKETKQKLLVSLRKELNKVKEDIDCSPHDLDAEQVFVLKTKKESFLNASQGIHKRVDIFEKRGKVLISWVVLNNQLCSTAVLCDRIVKTESVPAQILSQLVTEFKERFAADPWNPLFASGEFAEKLGEIQSNVQGFLYNYFQIYNKELAEIRHQFNTLLLSTPPPIFDASTQNDKRPDDSIYKSFLKLYQWIFEGFRTVVDECQIRQKSGAQWHDPDNKRRHWEKLEAEIDEMLGTDAHALDFEMLQRMGSKVLLMQRGFTDAFFGVYDNPEEPPNFEELERLFKNGRIRIQVEPKEPK